jgi:hypothetical protein
MEVYEVSPAVNKVANDTSALLKPFAAPSEPAPLPAARRAKPTAGPAPGDGQGSLF